MLKPTSNTAKIIVALLAFTGLTVLSASCTSSVAVGCGDDPSCPDTSGVATGKSVQQLTAEDRDAWCNWFVASLPEPLNNADPSDPARLNADGTLNTAHYACMLSDTDPDPPVVCLPRITVEECKQSLAVQPCTATIQALDDCARMLIEVATPGAAKTCSTERARCEAFLAAESCDGTVLGHGHPDPLGGWEPVCIFRVQ